MIETPALLHGLHLALALTRLSPPKSTEALEARGATCLRRLVVRVG